ncbi:MAG: hypothetical protein J6X83_02070, partial [Methanomicrobium sp.]|nr:hypothetical protein [Methanomicrobium sp.]
GYYESAASKSIASGSATTPATTVTANPTISVNSSTGVITASASATKSVTPTVSAGYVSSGTAGTITVSGSNTSSLSVQSGTTINPTESEQTAVAAGKYTTGAVKVGAISSTYVGSGITSRSSTDLSVSGDTVTAPAGYYAASASKAVASGTAGTPTATKGAVSNHAISVTPSVTNTTGYITGSTKTGTAVSVSASELVSGSETKTQNGTYDVTNLAELVVNVSGGGGGTPAIVVTTETLPNGADHVIVTGADISDTTAVAADVASGKYFYTAAGIKTEGTASGGGGGLDFDVKTVNVTSNTPTVTRAFNNFIFIAQVAEDELPETLSNNVSYFIMFAYVNGAFVNKSGDRGWGVRTNGSSYPFHGGSANFNSTSIGDTSITFSAYTSWVMYQANWKVLQIELPSSADYPLYSFSTH